MLWSTCAGAIGASRVADADYTTQDHAFRDDDDYARAKYDITLRWLGPDSGRTLGNVGCGNGLFNTMAAGAGFNVAACEPDPVAHANAVAAAPDGVEVRLGGLFDGPFDQPVDVVVMHDVLEHIADERAALEALSGLLRAGGRVVLSVPALPRLFGYHDELLGHYRRYTKASLRSALEPLFEIRRMRYFGFTFIPVTAWYSRFRRTNYPTSSATGRSLLGRAFSAACRIESRVPTPIGTSLVCELTPRSGRAQPT
jgi:2-polyprenyl-3-methyl-5-hydroxy-6-metoxy-1,4-benzoquinol methylase